MRHTVTIWGAALFAATLLFGSRTSHAQSSAWRCVDDPNLPECEDALINDIEAIIDRDWPNLTLSMPALPYTCTKKPGSGHQIKSDEHTTNFSSQINWSIGLSFDLRWFLVGQHSANADLLGSVTPSGTFVTPTSWPNTSINYLFAESSTEVMAAGGSTGVSDLGIVTFLTPSGDFWNGTVPLAIHLVDGDWDCIVGPAGATVRNTGQNGVTINYPIAWTPVQSVIAEGIRDQFRRAVRIAVTGAP
jgi:hypothetical protein